MSLVVLSFSTIVLFGSVVGCVQNNPDAAKKSDANGKEKPKTSGHALSKEESDKMIADVRDDMRILTKVRTDAEPLKEALAEGALEAMTKQVEDDLKAGKVKVRRFSSAKYSLGDYSGGIGGVKVTYRDDSYYENAEGSRIEEPSKKKTTLIVATQKVDGRWKIVGFYSPETKEPPRK